MHGYQRWRFDEGDGPGALHARTSFSSDGPGVLAATICRPTVIRSQEERIENTIGWRRWQVNEIAGGLLETVRRSMNIEGRLHCSPASPKMILLATSEKRTIAVQSELESQICRCSHSCEPDVASSIKSAQEP
jgi:hypothetical protein